MKKTVDIIAWVFPKSEVDCMNFQGGGTTCNANFSKDMEKQ